MHSQRLFLAVFFHMSHGSCIGMMPSVERVSPCNVRMMGRFFVVSAFMMLTCFTMVTRGVRMVFLGLLMVLGCLLRHDVFPPSGSLDYRCQILAAHD
jgi:hypothetical protein